MSAQDSNLTALVVRAGRELPYNLAAFEEIARGQYRWVCGIARGIVGVDAAESVAQDALLRAMHGLPKLEDPERFKAWLGSITVNVAKRHAVKEKREAEKRVLASTFFDESAGRTGEQSYELAELLAPLDVEERTLVCLKVLSEFEFQEIAEIVGLGLSATKMRYYRALDKMRGNVDEST